MSEEADKDIQTEGLDTESGADDATEFREAVLEASKELGEVLGDETPGNDETDADAKKGEASQSPEDEDDGADSTSPDSGNELHDLRVRAASLGMDPLKIQQLDGGVLTAVVEALEAKAEQQLGRSVLEEAGPRRHELDTDAPKQDVFEQSIEYLKEIHDPSLIAVLEDLHAKVAKQAPETTPLASAPDDQAVRWLDSKIAESPKNVQAILGAMPHAALAEDSPQMVARQALADYMVALSGAAQARGQTPPPLDDLYNSAVEALFSESSKGSGKNRGRVATQRKANALGRPSQSRKSGYRPTSIEEQAILDNMDEEDREAVAAVAELFENS